MLSTFADFLYSRGLSQSTIRDYEREVGFALSWCAARRVSLESVTPSQLREFVATRPNTPGVRSHLKAALCHWWDWREVAGWPGAIEVPDPPQMVCRALETDEAARLVSAAAGWWRAGAATIIALSMGFRNQGVRMMRWDGFDRTMDWYTTTEKGNKQRTVPVPEVVRVELDGRRNGSQWVFEGRTGGHVSHQIINLWVKQVGEKAGFPRDQIWPHRMRHTFAAEGLDNTNDLDAVAHLMGHTRTETTRGYTRTTTKRLKAVSDSLGYLQ